MDGETNRIGWPKLCHHWLPSCVAAKCLCKAFSSKLLLCYREVTSMNCTLRFQLLLYYATQFYIVCFATKEHLWTAHCVLNFFNTTTQFYLVCFATKGRMVIEHDSRYFSSNICELLRFKFLLHYLVLSSLFCYQSQDSDETQLSD